MNQTVAKDMNAAQQTAADDEIFLVDGSGYIFRAYFALPQNLTNPAGMPVGAVLGFSNMLLKLLTDLHAPYVAVIFDAARKNFRYDIYADYKANREEAPADLVPQFPLFRVATEAFGIPAIELEGFEADDLIATYAKLALAQGKRVTIVGTDKDLMQLVRPGVRLYDPIKNKYLGEAEVVEKFGVTPDKVADVQALAGDAVDNVPGVPGIGVKTAAQLINEYGDLESLLGRASEIKQPKRRESLIEHAEKARISKRLVLLDENVEVPIGIDGLKARDPHRPELEAFLREQGFKSLLTRLGHTPDAGQSATPSRPVSIQIETPAAPPVMGGTDLPPVSANKYVMINDEATLKEWIARAYEHGLVAIDTETTHLTPTRAQMVGISLSVVPGEGAYIPLAHIQHTDLLGDTSTHVKQLPMATVTALLKPLLEDPTVLKIGHNVKYDWQILAAHNIRMTPCDDTMLMSYILDGSAHGHGMDELAELFCGHTTIKYGDVAGTGKKRVTFDYVPVEQATNYAAEDAEITRRLYHILKPRLVAEKMATVYEDIERPLIPVIAEMEMAGIKADPAVLRALSAEFGQRMAALESEIHTLAGHPFNVASPKQLGTVLFDEMGLQGGSKTKTGDWSTAANVLEDLAGTPIVDKLLEYRQLAKLKSTYADALIEQMNPATGRVHTSYHMTGTNTGRLASTDPNLQNIPIRTEEGRKIRAAFVAEPGYKLLSVDYSQVELRLAAELAGVAALKQAFRDKVDIHSLTAAQVFGVPLAEVTPDIRRSAKAVNFGIIYGISGWGLAKQLGISAGEANEFIRRYLNKFSEIQDYMEAKKAEARAHGYVRTLYGRKCVIPNIDNKMQGLRMGAERQAINAPLQGTAADIMKKAMVKMPRALADAGLSARMLLQVHDELVFEVPDAELDATASLVKQVMESVAKLDVPLEAEAGSAQNWSDAH
ncbi:MAG: DNA polymerase I [Alphaproteobacteria bacterium]|nr:DNA polymerase I [Alphaproteobacteria bacterium]